MFADDGQRGAQAIDGGADDAACVAGAFANGVEPDDAGRFACAIVAHDPHRPAVERSRLFKYRVSQVLSGHSITIEVAGRFVLMKLLGVESTHRESRNFLNDLLANEEVCLEYDPDPRSRIDARGNPMAYLYRAGDGLWINQAMIARGYGRLAQVLAAITASLLASVAIAPAAFAHPLPPPGTFGRAPAPVVIVASASSRR